MKDKLIYGLVLTGGKSQRMGTDKALIEYHKQPHYSYLSDLLSHHCDDVFISVKSLEKNELVSRNAFIEDSSDMNGPIAGILSAMESHTDVAWLVIACDLPFVNSGTIENLITNRDSKKIATAFYNPETEFPEPLITLWEAHAYEHILRYIEMGHNCPRKVLINSDIHQIHPVDYKELTNANDPKVREQVKKELEINS